MNDDIKTTLDQFTQDMKALVNIEPKQFDILKIANMVSSLPPRKWNAAQAVVNATIAKKRADQKLRKVKAQQMMIARNNPTLKAAPDRTAWVDNQFEVQQAELEVITADGMLTAAKLAYECLDDLFTAGKRIMEYLIKQDRAERDYNRFAQEGANT